MDGVRINPRLVLFVVTAAVVAALLWSARGVLWPFGLGLVLAYLIVPVVNRVHGAMPRRLGTSTVGRPLAILVVYFLFVFVAVLAVALILPPVLHQASDLLASAPQQYGAAQQRLQAWIEANRKLFPPQLTGQVNRLLEGDLLSRLAGPVIGFLTSSGSATWGALTSTISLLLGLVLVPIWLVYILRDTGRVRSSVLDLFPHDIRPDAEALRIVADRVFSGYIRGQLVIAATLGVLFTVALTVLRVPYSLLLGFVAGVLAIVPFIGAIIGAILAVAVAFGTSAHMALLVIAAFIVIQLIDNTFVTPRIQGRAVALNPAVIMVVIVIAQRLFGAIGVLAAVPVTAILRDVVHYLYLRVGDDRLSAPAALAKVGYGNHVSAVVRGEPADRVSTAS